MNKCKFKAISVILSVCMVLASMSFAVCSVSAKENTDNTITADAGSWQKLSNGQWQYLENGQIVTGWRFIGNKWYYFENNGTMKTGWLESPIAGNPNSDWFYLDADGSMVTGWKNDIPGFAGKWFYFEPTSTNPNRTIGLMYWSSEVEINGKNYCFENNGVMKANAWGNIGYAGNPAWMYYGADGAAVTGWNLIGGKWYCFDSYGLMYANCVTPDGYYVDANGVWK